MVDENPVAAEMRLYALELMVVSILAQTHRQTGDAAASLNEIRRQFITKTRSNPFPGLDPATSDLASAELEAAFERLHRLQANILEVKLQTD